MAKHVSIAKMQGGNRARGTENMQPNHGPGTGGANYELNSGSMFQMGPATGNDNPVKAEPTVNVKLR